MGIALVCLNYVGICVWCVSSCVLAWPAMLLLSFSSILLLLGPIQIWLQTHCHSTIASVQGKKLHVPHPAFK